jgi:hypothetical protein
MHLIDNAFIGNSSNQYDLSPIFNHLTSGTNAPINLKSALLPLYPSQTNKINLLFDTYYYGEP